MKEEGIQVSVRPILVLTCFLLIILILIWADGTLRHAFRCNVYTLASAAYANKALLFAAPTIFSKHFTIFVLPKFSRYLLCGVLASECCCSCLWSKPNLKKLILLIIKNKSKKILQTIGSSIQIKGRVKKLLTA